MAKYAKAVPEPLDMNLFVPIADQLYASASGQRSTGANNITDTTLAGRPAKIMEYSAGWHPLSIILMADGGTIFCLLVEGNKDLLRKAKDSFKLLE